MLPDRLKQIITTKHEEIARLLPRAQHLRAAALQRDDFRGFSAALQQGPGGSQVATGIGIGAFAPPGPLTALASQALQPAGGSQPHNNMQPYLTVTFCIALQGVFPPRS